MSDLIDLSQIEVGYVISMPTVYSVFFSPQNREVTLKLIRYSFFMCFLPIFVFYAVWYFGFNMDQVNYPNGLGKLLHFPARPFFPPHHVPNVWFISLAWSGIAAVIAVNCVSVAYVIMAWNEDTGSGGSKVSKLGTTNKID